MLSYFDVLKDTKISSIYEVVGEWEVHVGKQTVKIKVLKDENEKYHYRTSHYYKGSEQVGPYVSSINPADSLKEALYLAKKQIVSFYNPSDPNAKWIKDEDY